MGTKIAFVSGALIDPINGQNRMKGYKEALAKMALSYNEGLVLNLNINLKQVLIWLSVSVTVEQQLPLLQTMS